MTRLLDRAQQIIDIALAGESTEDRAAIVLDRLGGIRILKSDGWSPEGLAAEFGAEAVYRLEKTGRTITVEGWQGKQHCVVRRETPCLKYSSINPIAPSALPANPWPFSHSYPLRIC